MKLKRWLSLLLSVYLMCLLAPHALATEKSYTINGTTVTASSGDVVWNCSSYATQILKRLWTVNKTMVLFDSPYNLLREKSAVDRELTEDHVREYIQKAPLGSRIRVCASSDKTTNNYDNSSKGHTMVLVARNDPAGTFTVLEAGGGVAKDTTYSYKQFADYFRNTKKYPYLFYILDYSAAATNNKGSGTTTANGSNLPVSNRRPTYLSVSTDKELYALNESVTITPTANNATHYAISVWFGPFKTGERLYVNYNLPGGITFSPTKAGTYTIRADAKNGAGYISTEKTFTVVEQNSRLPSNFSVSTNKSSLTLGESIEITPTADNATRYAITIWQGAFNTGTCVYENFYLSGGITFNPPQSGTYTIRADALNDAGYIFTEKTFTVAEPASQEKGPSSSKYYVYLDNVYDDMGYLTSWEIQVSAGGTYEALPTSPTRPGYIFDGWYFYNGTKITRSSPIVVNEDHRLSAHWIKAN